MTQYVLEFHNILFAKQPQEKPFDLIFADALNNEFIQKLIKTVFDAKRCLNKCMNSLNLLK